LTIRRLTRRQDTVADNRDYAALSSAKEITEPNTYTPVLAVSITPGAGGSVVVYTAASISVESPMGYGKFRVRWQQGGLYHTVSESEGKVLPLGGEEYHREFPITGLSVSEAIGISLEAQPFGATLSYEQANLLVREW